MNEYLAIDCGGCLCMNSLHALIAAWLNASQRSRDGVQWNRSVRKESVNCLEDSILRYIRSCFFAFYIVTDPVRTVC